MSKKKKKMIRMGNVNSRIFQKRNHTYEKSAIEYGPKTFFLEEIEQSLLFIVDRATRTTLLR